MPLTERDIRKLINTKQASVEFSGTPSINSMVEGQTAIEKKSNSQLAIYRKKYGRLWKSYMSSNGDQFVDKTLSANTLKYTNKFIDYRMFIHNLRDDIEDTKIYMPWAGTTEQTALHDEFSGYLTPYRMTCHKLLFRPSDINTVATDIVFRIEKIDSGDVTVDSICTFDATANWVDETNFTIKQSDWTANPVVGAGDLVGLSLQADNSNIVSGQQEFFITSVWKVEVVI